jgi:hypothetical protein
MPEMRVDCAEISPQNFQSALVLSRDILN